MTEQGSKENVNFGVLTRLCFLPGLRTRLLGGLCVHIQGISLPLIATVEFNLSRKGTSLYARDIVAMQQRNTI